MKTDFAISTQVPPENFLQREVMDFEMATCLSQNHALYPLVEKGEIISIDKILDFDFVAPSSIIYGKMNGISSYDGWRDDIHPRKIKYETTSLQVISDLVMSGSALAYLPKFYINKMGFHPVKIRGCKFKCLQKVHLSTAKQNKIGWIAHAITNFKR